MRLVVRWWSGLGFFGRLGKKWLMVGETMIPMCYIDAGGMHFPFFGCPEGSKQVLFCEGTTKGSVQNMTTLFFMGGRLARGATSRRLGIISACCHIMNYFCPKFFLI
jgi:hypothetical protein